MDIKLSTVPALPARFWDKVEKSSSCWEWTGCIGTMGYGQILITRENGTRSSIEAHRVAWWLEYGYVPTFPMVIDHLCGVRRCVHVGHMEEVPHAENVRRGFALIQPWIRPS